VPINSNSPNLDTISSLCPEVPSTALRVRKRNGFHESVTAEDISGVARRTARKSCLRR
jgi:hypothetical protein